MARVKIYTAPDCPQCRAAKAFFAGRNVTCEEVDVSSDARGRVEMYELSRARTVPVIVLDGRVLLGFGSDNRRMIEKALQGG